MKRPSATDDRWFGAALLVIILVGAVVRLFGTGDRTLFFDEAYYIRLALEPLTAALGSVLATPPSDPLYALMLHEWVALFGPSDFAARLPSVAFGTLTAAAAAWLALEVVHDRRVALLAALFVAVSPYAVEYGWEATPNALAALFTTLALAACWRWRGSGRRRDAFLAAGLSVIAVYSHYVAAAMLALSALLSLMAVAGPRAITARQLALMGAVVVVAWLPWLVPMVGSWFGGELARTSLEYRASLAELLGALSQYTSGTGALLDRVRPLQVLGAIAAAILVLRGWLLGREPARGGLRVILIVAALSFAIPWVASAVSGRWLFVADFMLLLLPGVAVVAAAGALLGDSLAAPADLERRPVRALRTAAPIAAVVLVGVQGWGLALDAVNPPHGDDGPRDLATLLAARAAPGDPVMITPNLQQLVFERYWSGPLHGLPDDVDIDRLYRPADVAADTDAAIRRFEDVAAGAPRSWLVYTPAREADARFLDWLRVQRSVTMVAERPFGQLYEVSAP